MKNEDKLILYTKLILKKPFDRHILSKPENSKTSVVPNQRIVTQNYPYPLSLENLATVQNLIVHPNESNLLLIQDHLKNYY